MEEVDAAGAALAPGEAQSCVQSVVLSAEGAEEGEPTSCDREAAEGEVVETAAPGVEATLWGAASEAKEEAGDGLVSGDWPSRRADVGFTALSGVDAASAALWGDAGDAAGAPSAASLWEAASGSTLVSDDDPGRHALLGPGAEAAGEEGACFPSLCPAQFYPDPAMLLCATQCSCVQYNAMQCNVMRCKCDAMQRDACDGPTSPAQSCPARCYALRPWTPRSCPAMASPPCNTLPSPVPCPSPPCTIQSGQDITRSRTGQHIAHALLPHCHTCSRGMRLTCIFHR